MSESLYSYQVKTIDGREEDLGKYRGQVLVIVNTASRCGFTPQYGGLEKLHQKFKEKGFSVLGFPCNQFGQQEPGNEAEIKSFCEMNYKVTFPMYAKVEVNGEGTHPLYRFLKSEGKGILGTEAIKWNFTKFLVNRQGEVVKRFAPNTEPRALEKEIESLL